MKSTRCRFVLLVLVLVGLLAPGRALGQTDETEEVVGLRHRVDRLEAIVSSLEQRVSSVESAASQPLGIDVQCGSGQSINNALAEHHGWLGPLIIYVHGACQGAVLIDRDDVTLQGITGQDSIESTASSETTVSVRGAQRVNINDLTIKGGSTALGAYDGSSFRANHISVEGASVNGVLVMDGSFGVLGNSTMAHNPVNQGFGAGAEANEGHLTLFMCEVSGNEFGVYAAEGGTVYIWRSTVSDNGRGVSANGGASVQIRESKVENNRQNGVEALHNSEVAISNDSRVAGNGEDGIMAAFSSAANIVDTTVENNLGRGINVNNGSTVGLFAESRGVQVTANGADGVLLQDFSLGFFVAHAPQSLQITGNGGWGINCAGPSAVASRQASSYPGPFPSPLILSGNGSGMTNCTAE